MNGGGLTFPFGIHGIYVVGGVALKEVIVWVLYKTLVSFDIRSHGGHWIDWRLTTPFEVSSAAIA